MKYDQTIITPKGLAVHIRNGVASDGSAVLDQHWFHTKEQMQFLDHWIKNRRPCNETENKDGLDSPAYSSGNRAGSLPCLAAGQGCSDPFRSKSQRVTYMYAKEKQQR